MQSAAVLFTTPAQTALSFVELVRLRTLFNLVLDNFDLTKRKYLAFPPPDEELDALEVVALVAFVLALASTEVEPDRAD